MFLFFRRDKQNFDFEVGVAVNVNYKGRGRFLSGVISRVRRLNGTYDIEYDDGNSEDGVDPKFIRLLNQTSSKRDAEDFSIGAQVFVKEDRLSKYEKGVISRVRLDGTFDVELTRTGELLQRVTSDQLKIPKISDLRSEFIERVRKADADEQGTEAVKFAKGSRMACYWYKSSKFGRAREHDEPKSCIVLMYHGDMTYTVEIEGDDGSIIDDVPTIYLKPWVEANIDLRNKSGLKKEINPWKAVIKMAVDYQTKGKIPNKHEIPSINDLSTKTSEFELNLELCFGRRCYADIREIFNRQDRYDEGEISLQHAVKGFQQLGAEVSESELIAWLMVSPVSSGNVRSSKSHAKSLSFSNFFISFANLVYGDLDVDDNSMSKRAKDQLRRSLRMEEQWSELSEFAKSFGAKQMKALERVFNQYSVVVATGNADDEIPKIPARSIIEAFHSLDKPVTVTRIQDWMTEADVRPTDSLTLADFACVFAYFFGPHKLHGSKSHSSAGSSEAALGRMTLSEIAVQTMQEERWRSTSDQVTSFVARLCSGRSKNAVAVITSIRDAFEALDSDNNGDVSVSNTADLFKGCEGLNIGGLGAPIYAFVERLKKQGRGTFSLPELFESFGSYIQDAGEKSISVSEAFSMLRLHNSIADVRLTAGKLVEIIDKILQNSSDPKYWVLNVKSEVGYILIV